MAAVTAYKEKAKATKPANDETPARPDAADEAGDEEFEWRGTQPGIGLWIVVNAKNSHCYDMEEIIKQLFLAAVFEFQFTYKASTQVVMKAFLVLRQSSFESLEKF